MTDPTCQAGVRDGVSLMSFPPARYASVVEPVIFLHEYWKNTQYEGLKLGTVSRKV